MQEATEKRRLFRAGEAYVLVAGLTLAACLAGSFVILYVEGHRVMLGELGLWMITHITTGRAAGISVARVGEQLGALSDFWVIAVSMAYEGMVVCIVYPLIVLSYHNLIEIRLFGGTFRSMMTSARTRMTSVRRYGLIGLFLFVWFPFFGSGPLAGALIGFLIGLGVWQNMLIVMTGTFCAIASWVLAYGQMERLVKGFREVAPYIVLTIIFGSVVVLRIRSLMMRKEVEEESHHDDLSTP